MRAILLRALVLFTILTIGICTWRVWMDDRQRVDLESPAEMLHSLWSSLEISKNLRYVDADANGLGEYCDANTLWKNHLGTGPDLPRPDGSIEILKAGPDPIWRSGTVPNWLMCVQVPRDPAQAEKHYRVLLWPRSPAHHPVAVIGTEDTLPKKVYVQSFSPSGVDAFQFLEIPNFEAVSVEYETRGWKLEPIDAIFKNRD